MERTLSAPAATADCPPFPEHVDRFGEIVLPHLDAAFRLARWLLANDADAEDAVQEASLRAFRYFHTFVDGDGRAWFLRIVRNACWTSRSHRERRSAAAFDEEAHGAIGSLPDPEIPLLQFDDQMLIGRAMRQLPVRFQELLVLRELEGLTYRELADAVGVPIGTVMSGLSRARQALRGALDRELNRSPRAHQLSQ